MIAASNPMPNPPGHTNAGSGPAKPPQRAGCCFTSNPSNPHGGVSESRQVPIFYYSIYPDTTMFRLDVLDIEKRGLENKQYKPTTTTILRPGGQEIAFGGLDVTEVGADD